MGRFRGEHAWVVLTAGIVGYEVACHDDELLSVAVDRWLVKHPILTRWAIAAVSLHLLNALPVWADVLSPLFWARLRRIARLVRD